MGLEVAGTVAAIGPGVKRCWKSDDKVMSLVCGGGYAEYVAVPEELLMPVPRQLSLCQAAAIPEAWLTAFQLLHLIGIAAVLGIHHKTALISAGEIPMTPYTRLKATHMHTKPGSNCTGR